MHQADTPTHLLWNAFSAHLDSLVCMGYLFVYRCKCFTDKQETAGSAHAKNILHATCDTELTTNCHWNISSKYSSEIMYIRLNYNKLITNRWAWALVPTKLVEPGNALAWGGGIHGNPASGPHQAPSHWTIQWNTYRPNTYLAHTKREWGMGKTKARTGTQTASNCHNTLWRTASKQLRI